MRITLLLVLSSLLYGCIIAPPLESGASKKNQYLRQLDVQLLLARAEWLLTRKRILNEIIQVKPNNITTKWELSSTNSQINKTSEELHILGTRAVTLHELDTADLCLTMANQLNPTIENTLSLARLEEIRYKEKLEQHKKSQRIERERLATTNKRLIKETYSAIASNNLIHASGLLTEIKKNKIHKEEIEKLQKSLGLAIQSRVKILLDEGNQYYSNGNIKQAKSTWEKALQLDPENEIIRERIMRADRVLEKLKQLKKKK